MLLWQLSNTFPDRTEPPYTAAHLCSEVAQSRVYIRPAELRFRRVSSCTEAAIVVNFEECAILSLGFQSRLIAHNSVSPISL